MLPLSTISAEGDQPSAIGLRVLSIGTVIRWLQKPRDVNQPPVTIRRVDMDARLRLASVSR